MKNIDDKVTSHTPQQALSLKKKTLSIALLLSAATLVTHIGLHLYPLPATLIEGTPLSLASLSQFILLCLLWGAVLSWTVFAFHYLRFEKYTNASSTLDAVLKNKDLPSVESALSDLEQQSLKQPLIRWLLDFRQPAIQDHLDTLSRVRAITKLRADVDNAKRDITSKLNEEKSRHPLIQAEHHLDQSIKRLEKRRAELSQQWEEAIAKASWFDQLTSSPPDFSEMDDTIWHLKYLYRNLSVQHQSDFAKLQQYFSELEQRAMHRLEASKTEIESSIAANMTHNNPTTVPLHAAMWLSAMSVPVSAWGDLHDAGNVYDALRSVNSNYADLSDIEIWLQTLFMPAEQLAGLASLTKGAYFEQLVAADTNGTLFEHFNNPDTDIVIDGIAYQIKASESLAYINTVDPAIPVISTSEVAEVSRAIDGGYSDAELERSVELAFGGSVVDFGDTTIDAILTGIGGLGLFATIQGINHASNKVENGGDAVEAVFEGLGVAIEGTARGIVGAAELGYKALTSRPSRFIGRGILAGLIKLDDKFMGK